MKLVKGSHAELTVVSTILDANKYDYVREFEQFILPTALYATPLWHLLSTFIYCR
jgi:hypothetical protein